MEPARKRHRWLLIVPLLVVVAAAGCGVKQDSPAPGCVEYWGIMPMTGGCDGRTAIIDLKVEPVQSCVTIEVNNCNGGVLEVDNRCAGSLELGGKTIAAGQVSVSLDLVEEGDSYKLVRVYSNFSDYVPTQDETVTILGTQGGQEIRVTFIKTRALC